MELTTTNRKLSLNKKVISKLSYYRPNHKAGIFMTDAQRCFTLECTWPECGSAAAMCRTDNIKSCAPCVPPPVNPGGSTKGC